MPCCCAPWTPWSVCTGAIGPSCSVPPRTPPSDNSWTSSVLPELVSTRREERSGRLRESREPVDRGGGKLRMNRGRDPAVALVSGVLPLLRPHALRYVELAVLVLLDLAATMVMPLATKILIDSI